MPIRIFYKTAGSLLLFVTLSVAAFAQPKAAFTTDVTKGCTPLVVRFSDVSTGNPTSWKWDLGNGSTSTLQDPGVIYINPGTYTIKLTVASSTGADSVIKQQLIEVYALPEANFSQSATAGCAPFNVAFTNSSNPGSGSILESAWDFGDGEVSKDLSPSHVYTFSDTFSVTLSLINSYGCKSSQTKSNLVKIPDLVKSKFDYSYTSVCQAPAKIDFENLSESSANLTYAWDFGDGIVSSESDPSHVFKTAGTYTISLLATTDYGCTSTFKKSISIGAINGSFSVRDSVCVNDLLQFSNTSNPDPVRVNWDFGDGKTSELIDATHAFTKAGTYTVKMVADFGSCIGTDSATIIVTNKPTATFATSSKAVSCSLPLTIEFTSSSANAVTYKWLFGDGSTSSLPNPSHTYTKAGSFNVSLITFNSNGCSDTVIQKGVVKTGPPTIKGFPGFPQQGCSPQNVNFASTISSPEPIATYFWQFGDGTTSTLEKPQHEYVNKGEYKVTLTVTTVGGCSDTYSMDSAVSVGATPVAAFSATPLATCAETPVAFIDESVGEVNQWLWMFGDGNTSAKQNPTHGYMDTGKYTITLIAMYNNCADTLEKIDYVNIYPPIAKWVDKVDCKNRFSRVFVDKSIGAKTWEWDFGDGTKSTVPSPTHTFATTGRYLVSLRVTNDACEFTKTDSIFIVDENPGFTYQPAGDAFCKNVSLAFTPDNYAPNTIKSFSWIFGDGTTSSSTTKSPVVSHIFDSVGVYNPFLVSTDINGCKDTANKQIKLNIYGPKADFSNVAGTCMDYIVDFKDKSKSDNIHPIVKYAWTFGDGEGIQQPAAPFTHAYSKAGNYTVTLAVQDSYGCVDTITKDKAITVTNPIARFTESDTLSCSNNIINFKSTSSGLSLKYSWSFGDGLTSTSSKPTHPYENSGIYTVQLAITDRYGCRDTVTKIDGIIVSNPHASFILNDTVGLCPPLLIEPKNTSSNYSSVNWDFGDSSNTNLVDPQHFYLNAGLYSLKLVVKGYGNCYDTAYSNITLKGPSGNLLYDKLTGCVPTAINFSSVSKNVAEYIWDFNNGVVKHTDDSLFTYTYKAYGTYLPKLVLVDSAGCKVSVENKDRIVISGVDAGMKQVKESARLYCDSSLFNFVDSSKAYYDEVAAYKWSFGDNSYHSSKDPTHYYNKDGTYNVKLTVVTKVGCADSIYVPVNVAVNKSPKMALQADDSTCQSTAVRFYASNTLNDGTNNTLTYKWDFGDGQSDTKQNAIHTYNAGGVYNVSILGTAVNGCTDLQSFPVTVYSGPKLKLTSDSLVCYGNALSLKVSGGNTYAWRTNPSLSCLDCETPTAQPTDPTWFYVEGSSAQGCKTVDSVFVNVYKPITVSAQSIGTLCLGQTTTLQASGSTEYEWSPATYLDNARSATPKFTATAPAEITYTVIGKDGKNCFSDTSHVTMKVYPQPTIAMLEKSITANAGFPVKLETVSSPDITRWQWSPATGLDSPNIASPTLTPKSSATYTVEASNEGNCSVSEEITVSVLCDGRNIFIPNTFSPNNDGMNDVFFPRGKGVFNIKSLRVFNRWGTMVFERMNFDANNPSQGWNGSYLGKQQSLDVYVYVMEVLCDNGTLNRISGNVTLLR